MIYKSQHGEEYAENELLSDITKFSEQLTLWGSNRVIKKWLKFRLSAISGEQPEKDLLAMEEILYAMRKDLGLRKMKQGNLLQFFLNDYEKLGKS